ncbi:hypothetical protein LOC67_20760 [Stieleria sp. JC731]|uniref:hypothetical protein n=1 Tax=Stieleria sp. JC731 TaxID=2894195 RepID=UPI001E608001|nr:hypothetical protein [Stieleria sp. JC731]MCC9602986.1 hypothetical protein [Stieleria sp. JC731]
MAINNLGYRPWNRQRTQQLLRPFVVARGGISLVLKRKWLRLLLLVAWIPVLVPAFGIFAFEYASTEPGLQRSIVRFVSLPLGHPELGDLIQSNPEQARHDVWALLILTYFRIPQLFAMVALTGMIAPLLVSYDIRTKAYLMYFSRPLTPLQYVLGKSAVIWYFLAVIITVPALLLYLLGILLSPDFSVIGETYDIPLRVLAASVVLVIPTTMLAVLYSSLTAESRYATFAWFATWVMGFVAYQFLTFSSMRAAHRPRRRQRGPMDWEAMGVDLDRWRPLSPFHMLGKVESWIFGIDSTPGSIMPSVVVLSLITGVGLFVIHRRIKGRLSV